MCSGSDALEDNKKPPAITADGNFYYFKADNIIKTGNNKINNIIN